MAVLRTILTVIFVIICIALTVLVLMQEGKSQGLGSISGMADTYWGKNKGRSICKQSIRIALCIQIGRSVDFRDSCCEPLSRKAGIAA